MVSSYIERKKMPVVTQEKFDKFKNRFLKGTDGKLNSASFYSSSKGKLPLMWEVYIKQSRVEIERYNPNFTEFVDDYSSNLGEEEGLLIYSTVIGNYKLMDSISPLPKIDNDMRVSFEKRLHDDDKYLDDILDSMKENNPRVLDFTVLLTESFDDMLRKFTYRMNTASYGLLEMQCDKSLLNDY